MAKNIVRLDDASDNLQEQWERLIQLIRMCENNPNRPSLNDLNNLKIDESDWQSLVLVKGNDGKFPLHLATEHLASSLAIAFLLGKDVNDIVIHEKDEELELAPIHSACAFGAPYEVIILLLERDLENKTIHLGNRYGNLPLHVACMNGAKFEVIKILLDRDVDNRTINVTNQFMHQPLHVYRNGGGNSFEIIKLLLDKELERKLMLKMNEMDEKLNRIQDSVMNMEQNIIRSLQTSMKTILQGGDIVLPGSSSSSGGGSKSLSVPRRPAGRRPEE